MQTQTRMHSSRIRTARLLTVTQHALLGVYLPGGCTCLGGTFQGIPAQGVCTCPGGVPAWGGLPAWGVPSRGYLPRGDVPARGVYLPRGYLPRLPPPSEQNPGYPPPQWTEWQIGEKILPCPKLRLRAVTSNDDINIQLHLKCILVGNFKTIESQQHWFWPLTLVDSRVRTKTFCI